MTLTLRLTAGVMLAAALVFSFRSTAAVANAAPPITVSNCEVLQAGPFRASGLRIAYHNTASIIATKVKFLVDYRGQRDLVVDTGSFAPGVKIAHDFSDFSGMVWEGPTPDHCRPIWVKFADGSIWQASTAPSQ
jgi:hypothetical protein